LADGDQEEFLVARLQIISDYLRGVHSVVESSEFVEEHQNPWINLLKFKRNNEIHSKETAQEIYKQLIKDPKTERSLEDINQIKASVSKSLNTVMKKYFKVTILGEKSDCIIYIVQELEEILKKTPGYKTYIAKKEAREQEEARQQAANQGNNRFLQEINNIVDIYTPYVKGGKKFAPIERKSFEKIKEKIGLEWLVKITPQETIDCLYDLITEYCEVKTEEILEIASGALKKLYPDTKDSAAVNEALQKKKTALNIVGEESKQAQPSMNQIQPQPKPQQQGGSSGNKKQPSMMEEPQPQATTSTHSEIVFDVVTQEFPQYAIHKNLEISLESIKITLEDTYALSGDTLDAATQEAQELFLEFVTSQLDSNLEETKAVQPPKQTASHTAVSLPPMTSEEERILANIPSDHQQQIRKAAFALRNDPSKNNNQRFGALQDDLLNKWSIKRNAAAEIAGFYFPEEEEQPQDHGMNNSPVNTQAKPNVLSQIPEATLNQVPQECRTALAQFILDNLTTVIKNADYLPNVKIRCLRPALKNHLTLTKLPETVREDIINALVPD